VRLGFSLGYATPDASLHETIAFAQEAERLGWDSAWASEAWGSDAVTVLSWLAATTERLEIGSAILQIPARTPAATAMTAATLDLLSGGRFTLGLGVSGPQVVEGWHGQPWGKPLAKTREYVALVRAALRREPLEHHGEHYDVPYAGAGATGLGKPLKLLLRPVRTELPIFLAAMGPKNVALAAEIADGWLPIFLSPERFDEIYRPALGGRTDLDIAASVPVALGDDVDVCRAALKPFIAFYVGGMGARGRNFYNDLAGRYGYEAEAAEIQDLYLDGKRAEATAAVPDDLVDEVALVGPRERIADRLAAWRECGVTTLICQTRQRAVLELMPELVR
jgi:F420-dependent oxidoreductase-like protein